MKTPMKMQNKLVVLIIVVFLLLISGCFQKNNTDKILHIEEDKENTKTADQQLQQSQEKTTVHKNTNDQNLEVNAVEINNGTVYVIAPQAPTKTREIINGHEFMYEKEPPGWRVFLQRDGVVQNMSFRYNPNQVKEVPALGELNATFDLPTLYITFDPTKEEYLNYITLVSYELSLHLSGSFAKNVKPACISEHPECLEVVRCDDTDKAVIMLENSPGAEIISRGNCLILKGQGEEIVKAVEKILFAWYGFYGDV